MRRIALYVILILGGSVPLQSIGQRTCGTEAHFQKSLLQDPTLLQRTMQAKALADQWLAVHQQSGNSKGGTVITVPVVVHVIYENPTENISDDQIFSQIQVLNEDYRKLNADTGDVPQEFKDVAADVEIEFCLAIRDTDGNPTNGITRTATTVTSFTSADPKSSAEGGQDGWPNTDYLNLWVCDLGGSLLGYATFPGGNPSQDGVVCGYQYIGAPPDNPFGSPFNKGRTATHEIGHYFGLSHTFQGGCAGSSATNCSTGGDGICDTPPTQNANYGCPAASQNTCTETPVDQNDMHMNYMDYVDDGCMNIFTLGQKARMQSVLNTSRSGLISSLGCMPVSALDASLTLLAPSDTICGSDQFSPVLNLINYGSSTVTVATINYQVDTDSALTFTWTGSLPMMGSEEVSLPMVSTSLGMHTFRAWVSAPNGGVDELPANDSTESAFTFMNGNSVKLTLDYDTFQLAFKVSWDIRDASGTVVDSSGGYSQNTTTVETICLDPGCYTFNLYDPVNNAEGSFLLVDVTGDTIVEQNDIYPFNMTFCVSLPPAAIAKPAYHQKIRIFPNPTKDFIYISIKGVDSDADGVDVCNSIGQCMLHVKHPELVAGVIKVDLTPLPEGIYFIRLGTRGNIRGGRFTVVR